MKHQIKRWLKNLPWKLKEVFICDAFDHVPALDLEFIPNLTVCDRCMAPLKKIKGEWTGSFAIADLAPPYSISLPAKQSEGETP